MRQFTKSLFSYSLAASLFSLKQIDNLVAPKGRDRQDGAATKAFHTLANAQEEQFGETLRSAFRMFDNVQRGLVGIAFNLVSPAQLGSGRNRDSRDVEDNQEHQPRSAEPIRWTDLPQASDRD